MEDNLKKKWKRTSIFLRKTRRRTPDVRLARPTAPGTRVETEPDLLAGPFKGKTKLFEL